MKQDLVKGYILEACKNLAEQDLLKTQLKEMYEDIKENADKLEISLADFKEAISARRAFAKQQEKLDSIQRGLDIVSELRL